MRRGTLPCRVIDSRPAEAVSEALARPAVAGFGDHCSAVGVADENHWTILHGNNALGCGDIFGQRYRRILNDADSVAVLRQDLIDTSQPEPSTKPPWTRTTFVAFKLGILAMMISFLCEKLHSLQEVS